MSYSTKRRKFDTGEDSIPDRIYPPKYFENLTVLNFHNEGVYELLSLNNTWTNQNTFVNYIPICDIIPTLPTQLVNKNYVDNLFPLLNTIFSGTLQFNNLPYTIATTPTATNALQLITKGFGDSNYGRLASTNVWSGNNTWNTATNTFNNVVTCNSYPVNTNDLAIKDYVDSYFPLRNTQWYGANVYNSILPTSTIHDTTNTTTNSFITRAYLEDRIGPVAGLTYDPSGNTGAGQIYVTPKTSLQGVTDLTTSHAISTPFTVNANSLKTTGDLVALQNRVNNSYNAFIIGGCQTGHYNAITITGDYGITWQQNNTYGFYIAPNQTGPSGTRWDTNGNLSHSSNITTTGVITSTNTTDSSTTTTGSALFSGGIASNKYISANGIKCFTNAIEVKNLTNTGAPALSITNRLNTTYTMHIFNGSAATTYNSTLITAGDGGIAYNYNYGTAGTTGFAIFPGTGNTNVSQGCRWNGTGNLTQYDSLTISGITNTGAGAISLTNKVNSAYSTWFYCGTAINQWANNTLVSGDSGIAYSYGGLTYGFSIAPGAGSTSSRGTRWDNNGNLTHYANLTFGVNNTLLKLSNRLNLGNFGLVTCTSSITQSYTITELYPVMVIDMIAIVANTTLTITMPVMDAYYNGITITFRNSTGPTSGTVALTINCNTGNLYYSNTYNGTTGQTQIYTGSFLTTTKLSQTYYILNGNVYNS
jgi:hypothetical protein